MSASPLSTFRAAIVRSVWSSQDASSQHSGHSEFAGFSGWCGPDFPHCLDWDSPRASVSGPPSLPMAPGHGPVHLLLISAAEVGFAWDGGEAGLDPCRSPGADQSGTCEAWQLKESAQLAGREGVRGARFLDVRGSLQLLVSSHLRERKR